MNDDRDPILDAFLSEALGRHTPPDLAARILQTWAAQGTDSTRFDRRLLDALEGVPLPPPLPHEAAAWEEPVAPPVQEGIYANGAAVQPPVTAPVASPLRRAPRVRKARHAQPAWLTATVAASALAAASLVGYVAYQASNGPQAPLANTSHDTPRRDSIAGPTRSPQDRRSETPQQVRPPVEPRDPRFAAAPQRPDVVKIEPKTAWKDLRPSSDHEIVEFVDQSIQASWSANKITPAPKATDAEWCRRVYLRLIGRIPTVEELSAFTGNTAQGKREALVDRLLHGDEYAEEFNRYWATQWSNMLVGRSAGEKEDLVSVEGLRQYLRASLASEKPYNQIVYELIAAEGTNRPGTPDFNGATNFLLASQNEQATLATARTSRIFLGKQLQCAQCHDHPFNEWTQHQFWSLNAFFRQMQVEKKPGMAALVSADFAGETGDVDEADVFYEQRNGQMKVAYPQFIDGTEVPRSGLVGDVDRREILARLVSGSDDLCRATVNRTWAHFLGYGFTRPVDDMGEHNPPTHPEVLERLAKEFKAHGYNTKSLLRWVALSEAFSLSSKIPSENLADAPHLGTAPLFSHYYTRQMQAEELYESLVAAAKIAQAGGTPAEKDQARAAWLGQFTQSLKTDEGDEEHTFDGTIPQSLMMMNGELMQQAISTEHSEFLKRVASSPLKPQEKVEHLFLAAVARKPTPREREVTQRLIATYGGDVNLALSDIWWALLNSNEFILDH